MSEQVNYQELEKLVNDQPRVHETVFYQDARPRTQKIYDQTIQMGQDILADRDAPQLSPQTMVDMAVQSINIAIKALKSNPVLTKPESQPTAPAPSSAQPQSNVRPFRSATQPATLSQSAVTDLSTAASLQPTQATEPAQSTTAVDTVPAVDTAPTTSPAMSQQATAPSQPTAAEEQATVPVQPIDTALTSESLNAQKAMVPEAAKEEMPTADKKKKDEPGKKQAVNHNLPMVVRQKPDWHLLPQAIWRGLQWTLGSKKILK
ncbi:hypothetical protein [Limosilactobacillus sp.]|uniref:FIVAR domain-containing protein n=1 Tax=Limosilactobacillus sp. TaxID=2773925 RepID=UPI003F1210B9